MTSSYDLKIQFSTVIRVLRPFQIIIYLVQFQIMHDACMTNFPSLRCGEQGEQGVGNRKLGSLRKTGKEQKMGDKAGMESLETWRDIIAMEISQ